MAVAAAIRFTGRPELMSEYACMSYDAGDRIIGGCCGTTPAHLKVMRQALERHARGPRPDLAIIESRLGAISAGATAQLSGNMDRQAGAAPGPTGRRGTSRRGARPQPAPPPRSLALFECRGNPSPPKL